jgi:hypothetical protein
MLEAAVARAVSLDLTGGSHGKSREIDRWLFPAWCEKMHAGEQRDGGEPHRQDDKQQPLGRTHLADSL